MQSTKQITPFTMRSQTCVIALGLSHLLNQAVKIICSLNTRVPAVNLKWTFAEVQIVAHPHGLLFSVSRLLLRETTYLFPWRLDTLARFQNKRMFSLSWGNKVKPNTWMYCSSGLLYTRALFTVFHCKGTIIKFNTHVTRGSFRFCLWGLNFSLVWVKRV